MSISTSAPARTVETVASDLTAMVDYYTRSVPTYREGTYIEDNKIRLQALIERVAKNPELLSDNLDEMFNRATIALLDKGE